MTKHRALTGKHAKCKYGQARFYAAQAGFKRLCLNFFIYTGEGSSQQLNMQKKLSYQYFG